MSQRRQTEKTFESVVKKNKRELIVKGEKKRKKAKAGVILSSSLKTIDTHLF